MEIYDFWSLLKKYEIKIPIIQRDYAQGRNTEFVIEVRNNFLKNLHKTLVNNKILSLDFIYGSVKENGNCSLNRKIFLPLDGQQRLTSLFLLHWYLFWKDDLLFESEDLRKILSGFKYETRISAKEFCYSLVNQDSLKYVTSIESLSDRIRNESWFFNSWEKDPTIISMLNMLDSIHEIFCDTEGLGNKLLADDKHVRFRFIKLENFGLDDSLYIKMNARGKLLTPFENFKAKIEKKLSELKEEGYIDNESKNRIIFKFDREWADLFWKYRDSKSNVYDQHFLALLQSLISYYAFIKEDSIPKIKIGFTEGNYFLHKDYIEYIDDVFIFQMEKILDFLNEKFIDKKTFLEATTIFNDLDLFKKIINKEKLINSDHIMFFAYCLYIVKNKEIVKEDFQNWMRVTSNLAENQIYNKAEDVQASIKSLYKLAENSSNILEHISDSNNEIRGFSRLILDEERLKARLILKSDPWKESILEAENHIYFKGQIMFLLDFSKINLLLELDNVQNINEDKLGERLESFKSYYRKSSMIFDKEKLLVDESKWRAALLSKGDYLLMKGMNHSFVTSSFDRDISWKRLLNGEKRKYVKELLDELEFVDLDKEIDKIIDEYLLGGHDEWYFYFIKYPELITPEYLGDNLFIRKNSEDEIYLLKTSRTSGRIREYYTTILYLELKDKLASDQIEIECEETAGRKNPNYLKFAKREKTIYIEYKSGWIYKYKEDDVGKEIELESLLKLLRREGYISI